MEKKLTPIQVALKMLNERITEIEEFRRECEVTDYQDGIESCDDKLSEVDRVKSILKLLLPKEQEEFELAVKFGADSDHLDREKYYEQTFKTEEDD